LTTYTHWFRETTPYISAHRDKTFVVSLPGEALAHKNLTNVVHDLALLKVIGVRLVIVHGVRPQLDQKLGPAAPGAWRVTSESDLPTLTSENAKLRAQLESCFSTGLPGSPLHNTQINVVSGNFVLAKPLGVQDGVDYLFTGQVRSLKTAAIHAALNTDAVVLLSPCGLSPAGQLYNLSAEDLAAQTAIAIGADKLVTFADSAYIKDEQGNELPELVPAELDNVLANLPAEDPSRRRLTAMLNACRRGVPRCPQVSYIDDGALLAELFTADGQGSQLSEEPYRDVRSATLSDVSDIVALIRPLEQAGLLRRRSTVEIEAAIDQFLVAVVDNTLVGCCCLHPYTDTDNNGTDNTAAVELACLAAHPAQQHSRAPVGDQLLAAAENGARDLGATTLFVLTTAARDWFAERGFKSVALDDLPAEKKAGYDTQRASQAMMKTLTQRSK